MWGREKLFYVFLGIFMTFFAAFTVVLYPNGGLASDGVGGDARGDAPAGHSRRDRGFDQLDVLPLLVSSELWGT